MSCRLTLLLLAVAPAGLMASVHAADIERDPIHYSTAPVHNAISRFQQRLESGEVSLPYDDHFGYLPGLLRELKAPAASQMLVFTKTSMQRQCITAKTPRAVYFNDDNYVGYCQDGGVLEIISVDPQLGSVFYTLDQEKADKTSSEKAGRHLPDLPRLFPEPGHPRSARPLTLRGRRRLPAPESGRIPHRSDQSAQAALGRVVRYRRDRQAETHGQSHRPRQARLGGTG